MASIIVGNANLGANNQGMTDRVVDSWKIANTSGLVDVAAAQRAFQNAQSTDDILNCSFKASGDGNSTISLAADNAYNAGRIVVAGTGNDGTQGNLGSPSSARKALGVGALDIDTQGHAGSDTGPAMDGRIKPDLVGFDDFTIARASSTTATARVQGASVATATITSAAVLWRDFLMQTGVTPVDPGQVYASLIAMGNVTGFMNVVGAGFPVMVLNGGHAAGWTNVGASGTQIDVTVNDAGPTSRVDVAIWWPETMARHNDIDLQVFNPAGTFVGGSASTPSVFERVRVNTTTTGAWKIRIKSYNVSGPQKVYWAFIKRS